MFKLIINFRPCGSGKLSSFQASVECQFNVMYDVKILSIIVDFCMHVCVRPCMCMPGVQCSACMRTCMHVRMHADYTFQ